MPHKKIQHFIKWFDIFIRAKTNIQKKKGKTKQKFKTEKPTCEGAQLVAPGPSPPPLPCRLPQAGARTAACRPCRGLRLPPRRRRCSTPPRASKTCHGDAQDTPHPFPQSRASSSSSRARFRRRPRTRRNAPPWKTRPTCAMAQESLSISFTTVEFVAMPGIKILEPS